MPTRQLKPGLCHSKRYNRCSWPAQSLYTRLLMHVDDHARYDADVELLAAVLFPFGDHRGRRINAPTVAQWLEELRAHDLVSLYQVNSHPYLQVNRWTERIRAVQSRFPGPVRSQMPATASNCQQPAANAALPSTISNPSTTTTTIERERPFFAAEIQASRTQAGALLVQIRELDARKASLTVEERAELRKKRRALAELQKKQAAGNFSTAPEVAK